VSIPFYEKSVIAMYLPIKEEMRLPPHLLMTYYETYHSPTTLIAFSANSLIRTPSDFHTVFRTVSQDKISILSLKNPDITRFSLYADRKRP